MLNLKTRCICKWVFSCIKGTLKAKNQRANYVNGWAMRLSSCFFFMSQCTYSDWTTSSAYDTCTKTALKHETVLVKTSSIGANIYLNFRFQVKTKIIVLCFWFFFVKIWIFHVSRESDTSFEIRTLYWKIVKSNIGPPFHNETEAWVLLAVREWFKVWELLITVTLEAPRCALTHIIAL